MRTAPLPAQIAEVEPIAQCASPPPTFRAIFDAELAFVWNTLRRFGVAERDLEDVAHETFIVVARKLSEFDATKALRPWLFAIAFRAASDYRKRAYVRREALVESELERSDTAAPHDELLAEHQERSLARRALLQVPEDRRAVLVLHDFEEVAMHDVAAALDVPLKTAYSRLRVGREELIAAARRLRKDVR